jgi:2-iminobutanoate/2-iminopropanoate deaminase
MAIESFTFGPAEGVPQPVAPFASATAYGELVFVTGQMPIDPATGAVVEGGIVAQTDQVMRNLGRVLELVGSGFDRVLSARAYLTDFDTYARFNEAYARWFPERLPSRTCVEVGALAVGALVEVDLVAVRDAV